MSTRSLTRIFKDDEQLVCMYRQCDGYPEGLGRELAEFLKNITMVNGLGSDSTNVANGGMCLAAQIVAHFKKGPGGVYLYPTNTTYAGQEYEYEVRTWFSKDKIELSCYDVNINYSPYFTLTESVERHGLFTGTPADFLVWFETEKEANHA